MNTTDYTAIRARHVPRWEGDTDRTTPAGDAVMRQVCNWEDCENDWPCDAHQLGVALEEARREVDVNIVVGVDAHRRAEAAEAREQRLRDFIENHAIRLARYYWPKGSHLETLAREALATTTDVA